MISASPPPGSPAGGHPPADGGVHLLPGAGEDPATAAEHPAQAVHPGAAPRAARGRSRGLGKGQFPLLGARPRTWRGGEQMEAPTPHAARVPRAPSFVGEPWDVLGTATGVALPSPGPGGGL